MFIFFVFNCFKTDSYKCVLLSKLSFDVCSLKQCLKLVVLTTVEITLTKQERTSALNKWNTYVGFYFKIYI